jgi:long-subunit fatty acid transport protein
MCADWGAWEFDWNPIDIYEYSDIVEYADNFLTGVGFTYTPTSSQQSVDFSDTWIPEQSHSMNCMAIAAQLHGV